MLTRRHAGWSVTATLVLASALAAQTKPATRPAVEPEVAPALPTAKAIQAQIARLAQLKDLDPAVGAKAVEAHKQALAQLQVIVTWQGKAAAFEAATASAPTRLEAIRKQLAIPASQPTSLPADVTIAQLEAMLAKTTSDLATVKGALEDIEAEPKRRGERRGEIPKLIAAAQKQLDEIDKKLTATPKGLHPELAEAERTLLQTRKEAFRAEVDAHQKELLRFDADRDLLTARRDLAVRELTGLEERVKTLQGLRDRKKQAEADRTAREAKAAAARAARSAPALLELAEANAALAARRTGPTGLPSKIQAVSQRLEEVSATRSKLQQDLKRLTEKAKIIAKTATFGVMLRKQRTDLPNLAAFGRRAQVRQVEISSVQLQLMDLEEKRAGLADIDAEVRAILERLPTPTSESHRQYVADTARKLLADRRQTLDALIKDHDSYFAKLIDLDANEQLLVTQARELAAYIDERVLWIRSGPVLGPGDLVRAAREARGFLGSELWRPVGEALWGDVRSHPLGLAIGLLPLALLLAFRRKLSRRLAVIARASSTPTGGSVAPTLTAVVLTALLAGTVPAIVWFVAWYLAGSANASDVVKAVSAGLMTAAALLAAFGLLNETLRPHGLAESHFHWPIERRASLRTSLRVLGGVLAALGFVVSSVNLLAGQARTDPSTGNRLSGEVWTNSLGRLALIVAMLVLAGFAQRLARPAGPTLAPGLKKEHTGWLYRLRHVWYPLLIAGPLALAALAALGFHFTALHLTGRLAVTFWLILAVIFLHAMALRWVDVLARKLAVRRLRKQASRPDADQKPQGGPGAKEAAKADVARHQARQLLRYGALLALLLGSWQIWSDSLPALAAARRAKLWTHTVKTTTPAVSADGTTTSQTVETVVPITLADAAAAVLIVVLTVVASRDLPGLVEIIVLQRAHVGAGARFATKTILSYVLAVTGVILAFKTIGVGWSSVQWLVAAMTVGLGFGLQEIFANFVSGLIILFERPIRIGDTVTVGETAGTVTRIRIRATTITDWDRKELIVPNKEFVTGRLVNWTLSDKVLRVIMRVGVAYGSDTELTEKILYATAAENPRVLSDPKPVVLFSTFGDNSLNFELRVYISGISHYLEVWHKLNMAIDKAFREHGITIAFPQRDTHLDTLQPLEVRIVPAEHVRPGPARGEA